MRGLTTLTALVLLALPTPSATSGRAAQEGSVEQTVSRRVHAYFAAMGRGELAVIEDALAADYLVIGGDGKLETRAERLSWLRANSKDVVNIMPSEVRVRLYDNTAVVTGLVVIRPDANARPIEERFTQVWVRRAGAWRMVTGQITILER